ncbi:TetR/AcrR family transcriptional regulator [Serratia fonticola]|jgi:AcrR family transcriptional regulator|uniref:Fatty acid metabolism regulator protein n=1 Tax=Serratia fonticola TaxID=47917 RepID=A0A0F7HCW4_SERFO|nr:TetR/AcrR family transcriptional regulator [Serratia fonticola]AKG70323.1 transcriptional regulator [Serratia fonticola]CAI1087109.1 Fatty acid metabolism regulator protein [Serratia fonticola]CAI1834149.1 Fatty acid metabolism regulator protein [Serratia fonticola]CAI1857612.1 Fatty acid metabolism regulator protein [Serratia fonticola]VTR57685.1 Fatty acid metabolism regulator protein [Serratia fonticola]
MVRTVKTPEVRRAEILQAASELFQEIGYESTSVDSIVRSAGIAKGTFYYYFKSKDEVLAALAQQLCAEMVARSQIIADDPQLGAIEKFCAIIASQNQTVEAGQALVEDLHRPENRALHERSNIETVLAFGPILAAVVEQGNQEGVFQVDDPLSTVQFILAGSLFLFGHQMFSWTPEEQAARMQAMLLLIERAFGAVAGSFAAVLGASIQGEE